jgi:hypothetical protein
MERFKKIMAFCYRLMCFILGCGSAYYIFISESIPVSVGGHVLCVVFTLGVGFAIGLFYHLMLTAILHFLKSGSL